MKKLVSLFLAAVITAVMCVPAYAAGGMENFTNINTYASNFTDVASSNWAASSISSCYEKGIMYGSTETSFNPSGTLTVAEAIVMAVRVHSIYNTGETAILTGGDPWYAPYVDYAIENGLIASADFSDYTAKITRSQMAYLFYNALPEEEYDKMNTISGIPDVTVASENYYEILGLYEAGVLTGSDSVGSFYPSNNITRAEAAAIIARVADKAQRKSFTLSASSSTAELTAQQISSACSPAVGYIGIYNASGTLVSSGSGFFIDSNGTFVTNYHVISSAASAAVTLPDGNTYKVEGIYDSDSARDTAILKVEGSGFPYLEVDTGELTAGDTIYVIGSPKGLANSLSSGLVSNASREINGLDYIQFTAPISSGSSGGALINAQGKVIGITSSSLVSSDTSFTQNINFAIPISYIYDLSTAKLSTLTEAASSEAASPSLTVSRSSLSVEEGSSATVTITAGSASYLSLLTAYSENKGIASIEWTGATSNTAELTVYGNYAGTVNITVFYDVNGTATSETTISVTVTSTSSSSAASSYLNGAPTYQSVTGSPCVETYFEDSDTLYDGYLSGGDVFLYDYDADLLSKYFSYITNRGWTSYRTESTRNGRTYYFIDDSDGMLMVTYDRAEAYIMIIAL